MFIDETIPAPTASFLKLNRIFLVSIATPPLPVWSSSNFLTVGCTGFALWDLQTQATFILGAENTWLRPLKSTRQIRMMGSELCRMEIGSTAACDKCRGTGYKIKARWFPRHGIGRSGSSFDRLKAHITM
jgi:hypothetical protein